jgi:hypothetical protein
MNDKLANEQLLIERYVLGKLDETEAEAFEAYYLDKPELIAEIEASMLLHQGLRNTTFSPATTSVEGKSLSIPQKLSRQLSNWLSYPVPAYVFLPLLGLGVYLALPNTDKLEEDSVNILAFSTIPSRSNNSLKTIYLEDSAALNTLLIKIPDVQFPKYVITLSEDSSDTFSWESKAFQFNALLHQTIVLPHTLSDGRYQVNLFGIDADGNLTAVSFCSFQERCRE